MRDRKLLVEHDSGPEVCVGRSGCQPFVPVMKAADLWDRHDPTIAWRRGRTTDWRVLVQ